MSNIKAFAVAVCAAIVIWLGVPAITHAGTGQNWDCTWGYLQVQNWDNGQSWYKIAIYSGQTPPSSVQPLYTGSATNGLVTEAMITSTGTVSSLISGSSVPSNGMAIRSALTAFATKPDCTPATTTSNSTFRGFGVSTLADHAATHNSSRSGNR